MTVLMVARSEVGELLRVRFAPIDTGLSFHELKDAIEGMEALFLVHAVLAGDEIQPKLHTYPARRRMEYAAGVVEDVQVRRLNYNSPLEIYFSAVGVVSVGLILFNRIVHSFNAVQGARVKRAQATTDVERAEFEREIIDAARRNLQYEITPHGTEKPNSDMSRAISAASRVLADLESVEIVTDPDSDDGPNIYVH